MDNHLATTAHAWTVGRQVVPSASWVALHRFGSINASEPGMVLCRNYAAVDLVLVGEDEDPRPGVLVSIVSIGTPQFGAINGEGLCADATEDWTVFGLQSDTSAATELVAVGEWSGAAAAEDFDTLCQPETYENAGWDFENGAWNAPTGTEPPTLR